MREKLQEYALIAEIISSIAILGTLAILILEMRDNTAALQSANIQSMSERIQQFSLLVASNPEFARVSASFFDPNFSDESEVMLGQQIAYLASILKIGEEAYIQYKAGLLSEEYWLTRAAFVKTRISTDRARNIFPRLPKDNFIPDYFEWLESELSN